jgi:hypothetical protein
MACVGVRIQKLSRRLGDLLMFGAGSAILPLPSDDCEELLRTGTPPGQHRLWRVSGTQRPLDRYVMANNHL